VLDDCLVLRTAIAAHRRCCQGGGVGRYLSCWRTDDWWTAT